MTRRVWCGTIARGGIARLIGHVPCRAELGRHSSTSPRRIGNMKRWLVMCGLATLGALAGACSTERPPRDATAPNNAVPDSNQPPHRTANPSTGTPGIRTNDPK